MGVARTAGRTRLEGVVITIATPAGGTAEWVGGLVVWGGFWFGGLWRIGRIGCWSPGW